MKLPIYISGYIYLPIILSFISLHVKVGRLCFLGFCVIQDVDLLIEICVELQQMSRFRLQSFELNPVLLQNYKKLIDPLADRQRCERREYSKVLST